MELKFTSLFHLWRQLKSYGYLYHKNEEHSSGCSRGCAGGRTVLMVIVIVLALIAACATLFFSEGWPSASVLAERERKRDLQLVSAMTAAVEAVVVKHQPTQSPPPQSKTCPLPEVFASACAAACAPAASAACSSCAACEQCSNRSVNPVHPSEGIPSIRPTSSLNDGEDMRKVMRALAPFSFPQLYGCRSPPHPPIEGAKHGSQSHEDEWVWDTVIAQLPPEERVNGYFIELGALDGITYSNTLWFEKALGWRGILIEGHPDNSQQLVQAQRTTRTNTVAFANSICKFSPDGGPGTLSFTLVGSALGTATESAADAFLKAHHGGLEQGPKRVDCVPMQALLDTTGVLDVDFLSLDVEGAELMVLETIDFSVTNIRVIVIELDGHDKAKDDQVRTLLRAAGFESTPTSPRSACRPGEDCTANDGFINPRFAQRKDARRQVLHYAPGTGTRCD